MYMLNSKLTFKKVILSELRKSGNFAATRLKCTMSLFTDALKKYVDKLLQERNEKY